MRRSLLHATAAASNIAVASATLALQGWNASGAHAAARNTARLSSLWFVAAFAAPGLMRWLRQRSCESELVWSFVTAHVVHFAIVAALIIQFESAHLVQSPGTSIATVLAGVTLVLAAGLTVQEPTPSRARRVAHGLVVYLLFLIFFLAFAHNPVKPVRLLAIAFAIALILRLSGGLTPYTARAKA